MQGYRASVSRAESVIIGNGIAGMTAALVARHLAPEQTITLFTVQNHSTIHTPALKQYATGEVVQEQLLAYPVGIEQERRIEIRHQRVERIDAQQQCLILEGGATFRYGSLLIATGSQPNGLPATTPGRELDGIVTLHRLKDYLDLSRRLRSGEVRRAVVIGGGVHAAETAISLTRCGIEVHWLLRGDFMARILDHRASEIALEYLQSEGIHIHGSTSVMGIAGRIGTVVGVVSDREGFIPADLVVACTGTRASLDLAQHCDPPINCEKGILVDEQLYTNIPHILAAGDVASLRNPCTNKNETRAQWYAAEEQGRLAGAVLAGKPEQEIQARLGVPWHATQLGTLSILTIGSPLQTEHAESYLTLPSDEGYRRLTVAEGRLRGYLSVGHSKDDGLGIKRLIDEGVSLDGLEQPLLTGTFTAEAYFPHRSFHQLASTAFIGIQKPSQQEKSTPDAFLSSSLNQKSENHVPASASRDRVEQEIRACIGCNECLLACPALAEPLLIDNLNRETLNTYISPAVRRFARDCYQCGACVPPCPVNLHRDAMMMHLKVRLLTETEALSQGEKGVLHV